MYKSKLQELCHQKRWGLPKYSSMKDGPDHTPHFQASVSVNAITFDTPICCKSFKEAHNEAAKLAFLHLTSGSSNPYPESKAERPQIEETNQSPKIQSNTLNINDDLQYQYKMQLQSYAQKKNIDLPLYSSKREGPPHAPCFKATVTIDGHSFESPGFYKTLKEAEHAAARVSLMLMSLDSLHKNDSLFYKNLLQELAQNEGFMLPTYKTMRFGQPHKPIFVSTVEVEGEVFDGKAAKSKKQAELNAAMAAYTTLMKRKSGRIGDLTSPDSSEDEALEFTPGSDLLTTVDPQENLLTGCPLVSTPSIKYEQQDNESKAEYQELVRAEDLSVNAEVSSQELVAFQVIPDLDEITGNRNSYSSPESLPSSPKQGQPPSSKMTPPDLSVLSIAESNKRKTMAIGSYLLCDRVRVYTCIPDMDLPKGTIVLPISEDKWVAVSLEFPNEKDT